MTESLSSDGVLNIDYHYQRKKRRSYRYRLWRRGQEVVRIIETYFPAASSLLDVGTADGLMLPILAQRFPKLRVVGLDRSWELLEAVGRMPFRVLQADATMLPVAARTFDVVSATAVIEHLHAPLHFLEDCRRVLKPGGICIITTPDPFFEQIATRLRLLPQEQHHEVMNLDSVKKLVQASGMEVITAEKFMLSPVGFPFEIFWEQLVRRMGLGGLLLNQIIVGRCPE